MSASVNHQTPIAAPHALQVEAKEKEGVELPKTETVHIPKAEPRGTNSAEKRTSSEGQGQLDQLRSAYEQLERSNAHLEGRISSMESKPELKNSTDLKDAKAELSANKAKQQEIAAKVKDLSAQLGHEKPKPIAQGEKDYQNERTAARQELPKETHGWKNVIRRAEAKKQEISTERTRPPLQELSIEPIERQKVSKDKVKPDPKSSPAEKSAAQRRGEQYFLKSYDLWGQLKLSERGVGKEIANLQREISTEREERATIKEKLNNPKTLFSKLEDLQKKLIEVETKLEQLEAKEAKTLALANTTQGQPAKITLVDGGLKLEPRINNETTSPKSPEARAAVKQAIDEMKSAHEAGVREVIMPDGSTEALNRLLERIYSSKFGKEVLDNNPDLKNEIFNLGFELNTRQTVDAAQSFVDLYKDYGKHLQTVSANISQHQAKTIGTLRESKLYNSYNFTNDAEREAFLNKIPQPRLEEIYRSLNYDTGGMARDTLVKNLMKLFKDPKLVLVPDGAGNFLELNPTIEFLSGPKGFQFHLDSLAKLDTSESRAFYVDGSPAPKLVMQTGLGGNTERTEKLLKTMVRQNGAYEKIPEAKTEAVLTKAFDSNPKNYKHGFAAVRSMSRRLKPQ